ncbi:MAG: GtrA family protein, partial [Rhodovibrionaceae bacterium]
MRSRPQKEDAAAGGLRYEGEELEIFRHARRWKAYWSELIQPFLRGEVVEVGAGIGGSTEWLAHGHTGGWLCLEPDPTMAQEIRDGIAAGRLPGATEVLCGTLEDLPAARRFDTALYIDVLEHIESDAEELARVAARLKPGGRIVVLAPAYQWLFSPFDRSVGHFRRYTAVSLDGAAPRDTRRIAYGYVDCLGLPLSLANRAMLRQATPSPWQIRFWDGCLVPLSRPLDRLLSGSFGKTLIAVYEKPGRAEGAEGASPPAADGPLALDKGNLLTKAKRFGVVGILATLIHVCLFGLLVDLLGWNAPTPATGIAFLAATTFSYFTNYRWTFGTPGRHSRYMPRFFTVTTSLFLLNLLIM